MSSGVFTFATFIEAKLQTTLSPGSYLITILPSSIDSSINLEVEVF